MSRRSLIRTFLGFSASGLVACATVERHEPGILDVNEVEIESDVWLDTEPGYGAAVFVEYTSGGEWEVFTTCDTELSGFVCAYDVLLSVEPGQRLRDVQGVDLEVEDAVVRHDRGVVQLLAYTAFGFDRVRLRTAPGATLRVDAWLDDYADPLVIVWNGYGSVQRGGGTNPLDLTPNTP